jgi:outer membrane protein OmpA-like peptidoglycan-associated protein
MNGNLMDMAKDYLSPDLIKKFGAHLGETPDATQKGLASAVPAVMGGFVRQATTDPTGASVTRLLGTGQRNGERLDDASSMIGKGQGMLGSLFGDRLSSATDYVAHSSGLGQKSAGKILALAAPIMGGIIGREAITRKLNPAGMASMLAGQKGAVSSALGAGGLGSIFGVGADSVGAVETRTGVQPSHVERIGENVRYEKVTPEGKPAGRRIGLPGLLLGLLAVLVLLGIFGRRHPSGVSLRTPGNAVPQAQAPRVQAPAVPAPPTAPPTVTPPTVETPTPPAMGGGPSAAVSELNSFFSDTSEPTPKRVPLDNVTFDHDSDRLTAASATSIQSVAAVLKAHPTANMRIDGFTDNTGDPQYNKTLSANRANAVRDALIRDGVDEKRISIAANGAENPAETNDTEQGRAANRRIELVVTSR